MPQHIPRPKLGNMPRSLREKMSEGFPHVYGGGAFLSNYAEALEKLYDYVGQLMHPDISSALALQLPKITGASQVALGQYLQALSSRGFGKTGLASLVARDIGVQSAAAASRLAAELIERKQREAIAAWAAYLQGLSGLGSYLLGKERIRTGLQAERERTLGELLGKALGLGGQLLAILLSGGGGFSGGSGNWSPGEGEPVTSDFGEWG